MPLCGRRRRRYSVFSTIHPHTQTQQTNKQTNTLSLPVQVNGRDVQHYQTVYGGEPLRPMSRYSWTVACSSEAEASTESAEATFYTQLSVDDWSDSVWLAGNHTDTPAERTPNNLFRSTFAVRAGTIVHARAYVAGLGLYHLFVNGARTSDAMLAPGWTTYAKVLFQMKYARISKYTFQR